MISNGLHFAISSMNLSLFLLFGFLHLSELHGQLRHFSIVRPPLTTAIWAARANVWRTTNRASFHFIHLFSPHNPGSQPLIHCKCGNYNNPLLPLQKRLHVQIQNIGNRYSVHPSCPPSPACAALSPHSGSAISTFFFSSFTSFLA